MAIDYKAGQAPKGPSNSNPMASTPGTQQSALQNVGGLNLNPNMPAGPQMQKRGRSSFQQSVMPTPAPQTTSTPLAGGRARQQPGRTGSPTVSRGLPMDPGRGYNVFSGMDANQISDMNSTMGLSNMTALPSLNPAVNLSLSGGPGPAPGQMGGGQVKWGLGPGSSQVTLYGQYVTSGGSEFSKEGFDQLTPEQKQAAVDALQPPAEELDPSPGFATEQDPLPPGDPDPNTFEEGIYDLYETPLNEEAAAALDEKYAYQLQSLLAGLDRQAAMMGTFGSGGHSTMINNAISGALANMADEYAALTQASRAEEAGILGAIGDMEDGLAGSEEIRMVANSIFEQDVFAPAIATYSAFEPTGQVSFFMDVANNIKTKFQQEYSSAANQAQRDAIVDKYRTISSQFQTLLLNYAKRDALKYSEQQANIDLQALYAAAGFTGDDESQGSYIAY